MRASDLQDEKQQADGTTAQAGLADRPVFSRVRVFLAWCVHLYTALGLVAAAGMGVLIFRGDPESFRGAFLLMLLATAIDATDGLLARAVRVKEVLPQFDGRKLDDLVDFLTFVVMPLFLIGRAELLPAGMEPVLLLPLLASAYGFCQVSAKTDDGFFIGFPSYWNLVAFYLYILHAQFGPLPGWFSVGLIVGLALLTFVPIRYLYPSQRGRLNVVTSALAVPWSVAAVTVLVQLHSPSAAETNRWLTLFSLLFPAYYLIASWALSWRIWRRSR